MAVTLITIPASYTPGFNPQWFKCSSTQTAQPNFRYRIVFTDLISGGTVTKDQDADPSGFLDLDASPFCKQYLTQPVPYGNYGFQLNTGAIRKIRVNVGEVYGATPTYYAGANTDYIVWNGAIDFLERQAYNYQNYLYDGVVNSRPAFITNMKNANYDGVLDSDVAFYYNDEKTVNKSSYAYCLSSGNLDLQFIKIVGFNSAGTQIATTTIANTNSSGTTYTNKYVYIDLGYKGLLNMPSGQVVAGTYPIPVSTYDYWEVYDVSAWVPSIGLPIGPNMFPIRKIYKECEPRFDVVSVHYLSPEGSYETCLCKKLSLRKTQVNKSYYSKLPYTYGAYNYSSAVENGLTSNERYQMTLNTDWLEEYEAKQYRDIMSSTSVFIDQGDTGGWIAVKVLNNSYEEKKKYNSSMISIQIDVEFAHINPRQTG